MNMFRRMILWRWTAMWRRLFRVPMHRLNTLTSRKQRRNRTRKALHKRKEQISRIWKISSSLLMKARISRNYTLVSSTATVELDISVSKDNADRDVLNI
jgi:hypothetical protein